MQGYNSTMPKLIDNYKLIKIKLQWNGKKGENKKHTILLYLVNFNNNIPNLQYES